jgi:hypothetical protein
MSRRGVLAACAVAVVLAACGSAGVRLENPEKTDSSAPPASSAPPPSPSWTPPDYGTAQPAVQAYLDFFDAHSKAFLDPTHVDPATFDKYLMDPAKSLLDQNFADEKQQGKAYRGTPDQRRVQVVTNDAADPTLPQVTLRDCPDPSASYIEFYVATGEPVPETTTGAPIPWAYTVKMFYVRGQWTIADFTVDATKTCTP